MNRGTILFRVDGSSREGMGRVARCLALANALQRRRYQMTFISQLEGGSWPDRIRRFRHGVSRTAHAAGSDADRESFLREIGNRNPTIVVTDGPSFSESYLTALTGRAPLLISLDDAAQTRFPGDLVLNPTLGRITGDYLLRPGAQLLAGDRYTMIRSEFRRARNVRATEPGGPTRVLIALGGGDNAACSRQLAAALLKKKRIEKVEVILGCESPNREALDNLAAQSAGRLHVAVDARDLGTRMTKAHLLIAGGGNTALEAACVGMPMLLVIRDERHELNAVQLDEIGVAQYLGAQAGIDPDEVAGASVSVLEDNFERKAMSRSGRMLVDGRGADRIVTAAEILLRRSRRVKAAAA